MTDLGDQPNGKKCDDATPSAAPTNDHIVTWAAVSLLLLGAVALLLIHNRSAARIGNEHQAAMGAAEKVALDITSVGGNNAAQLLDRLSEESTSEFRDRLDRYSTSFAELLREGQVASRATVAAAGVEHLDEHTASTLVAVSAVVVNKQRPDGVRMSIRLNIRLEHVDGRWLAAGVDNVT